jgi:hypothetical protein
MHDRLTAAIDVGTRAVRTQHTTREYLPFAQLPSHLRARIRPDAQTMVVCRPANGRQHDTDCLSAGRHHSWLLFFNGKRNQLPLLFLLYCLHT